MPRALISTPPTFTQARLAVRLSVGLPVILCVAILHNLRRAYRLCTPNLSHSRLVLFQNNGTRDGGARGKTGECIDAVQALTFVTALKKV